MTFALILVVTAILCVALADVIRKVPWVFYALAIAAVAVLFAGVAGVIEGAWWKPFILLVRRCMVALALFVVVMFTGALPRDSKLGLRLRSVRSELSILACILCAGHVLMYLAPYASRLVAGGLAGVMLVSVVVALVLAVLLLVLGVTSLTTIKKRMNTTTWKKIQRFAYVFFGLSYVHLLCMLGPAAFSGSTEAIVNVGIYTAIFAAYLALRLVRWSKDRAGEDVKAAA